MTTLEQMGAKAKDASRFLMTAGSKRTLPSVQLQTHSAKTAKKFLQLTKLTLRTAKKAVLRRHFSTDSDCQRRESTVWLTG